MRSSHTLAAIQTTFDEDDLVANAGLFAPGALDQKLGVAELVDEHLKLPADAVGRANGGTKAMTVIGAMVAGGDSNAEVDVLRAAAGPELFDQGRATSTIGTWLRGFIWASVRMLDSLSRQELVRAWQAGLGPDLTSDLTVDFDSTIYQVYGTGKQGARFGYTKVRGDHPLLATLASTTEVLHARMRGGKAGPARGAGAGATGKLTFRAGSAFYSRAFVTTRRNHDIAFSATGTRTARSAAPSTRSTMMRGCRSRTGSTVAPTWRRRPTPRSRRPRTRSPSG